MRHGWVLSLLPTRDLTLRQPSGPITRICPAIRVSIPLIDGESGYNLSLFMLRQRCLNMSKEISHLQGHPLILVWSCSPDRGCGPVLPLKASSSHGPLHVSSCRFC